MARRHSFYPRHPRGWRHYNDYVANLHRGVSIHATLAGGDATICAAAGCPFSFYPRHPRGWRRFDPSVRSANIAFLSTPPSRVATSSGPLRWNTACCFYPRHPRGWRLPALARISVALDVSIHATLAGGDFCPVHPLYRVELFLSTPPSRVATINSFEYGAVFDGFYPRHPRGWRLSVWPLPALDIYVSIHATLAGGDFYHYYLGHQHLVSIHATLAGGDK